ncbi:MAG: hypothetical protein ACLGIN_04445 [Candidatus Sericytochromatia bacterium]
MILDRPIFDIQHRIKFWLGSLSEEQRTQLRKMNPEDSLRTMLEGMQQAPPLLGRGV